LKLFKFTVLEAGNPRSGSRTWFVSDEGIVLMEESQRANGMGKEKRRQRGQVLCNNTLRP
jgi:hypothetical protein